MAEDNLPLPSDPRPMAMLPANLAEHGRGEWNGDGAPAPSAGPDLMVYLHALRRHWLMALGIGLLCAAIAGPAVWFVVGVKYTASSALRVAMQEDALIYKDNATLPDRDRFEIYKSTQQQLLESRFVLMAALRKSEVKNIPVIRYETQNGDPVAWLEKWLSVSFPGRAEVMTVGLSMEEPKEAQAIVKAVVDSYLAEVVNSESDRKRQRLSEVEKICSDREQEMRAKREQLKKLAVDAGSSEAELLNVRQKLALEELSLFRGQQAKTQFEMGKLQGELAAQRALLKNIEQADVSAMELDMLVMNDPVARQLSIELGWKKMDEVYTNSATKPGVKSGYTKRYGDEVGMLQSQYDARLKELQAKARQKNRMVIETEILRLEALLTSMGQQQQNVTGDIAKMRGEAEKFGVSSVDIEMLRSDLRNLDLLTSTLTNEREKLRVEIRSTPRITLLESAEEPIIPSNKLSRIAMVCFAMLVGLCCPAVGIAVWDTTRSRRINTTDDVSKGLHLRVIGSMPMIPSRVIRQLGSPAPRYRAWHLRLTESVDGITARVLHKADLEQTRVIMVSSANGGEGKTTLATQLALSLARSGRRTVLVDFDLRRPAFDEVFGVPLSPGVSETLLEETSLADVVHETATDNLSVVTAGRWNRQALASLSNGGAAPLFKHLREEFDFVIVDTSPLLPVADARFVSQLVDSVVLSVFRDVSEAPKIQAACDILTAFGVHSIEAVVTAPVSSLYGRQMGYESTVTA